MFREWEILSAPLLTVHFWRPSYITIIPGGTLFDYVVNVKFTTADMGYITSFVNGEALKEVDLKVEMTASGLSELLVGRATIGRSVFEKMRKKLVAAVEPYPNLLAKLRTLYVLFAFMVPNTTLTQNTRWLAYSHGGNPKRVQLS